LMTAFKLFTLSSLSHFLKKKLRVLVVFLFAGA
jgi:hypothetical protein